MCGGTCFGFLGCVRPAETQRTVSDCSPARCTGFPWKRQELFLFVPCGFLWRERSECLQLTSPWQPLVFCLGHLSCPDFLLKTDYRGLPILPPPLFSLVFNFPRVTTAFISGCLCCDQSEALIVILCSFQFTLTNFHNHSHVFSAESPTRISLGKNPELQNIFHKVQVRTCHNKDMSRKVTIKHRHCLTEREYMKSYRWTEPTTAKSWEWFLLKIDVILDQLLLLMEQD